MSRKWLSGFLTVLAFACCATVASAQQMSNPYGAPVTLDAAKKIAAPALAEARKNNWTMAVAIVDTAGDLVYFERMDNTQLGSINTAILKARSAVRFKRPTRVFQDMVASGGEGLRALGLEGAMVVEGGIPLVVDGKIVGAVGASGGTSAQDGQCAKAAAALVK
jgi:glc operon protein GlcG